VAKVPPLRTEIVKRSDNMKASSPCGAAGCSSALSLGSDATGVSPKDFENLAKTLGAFVALASIQLALRRVARA